MAADFKYIVVGRGMMGAAAAKYLAMQGDGVAVIGPDEPENRKTHKGVFASHYDEGRITRTVDPDRDWALLANRSIARYGEIEAESGINFYTEAGCAVVACAGGEYARNTKAAVDSLDVPTQLLDDAGLRLIFPFFSLPSGCEGVFQPRDAGYISPRSLVKAQSAIAAKRGATVVRDYVTEIREEGGVVAVRTSEGKAFSAEKLLLAAGGFSIGENLLPDSVEMSVHGRTVTLFEVSEEQAAAYAAMPSLILETADIDIYLLPPIRYPDGKLYLKIGGDPDDYQLKTEEELRAWFRTEGRPRARDHLMQIARRLLPDLKPLSVSTASCAVSHTGSAYPMIGFTSSPAIAVLTGCAGTSAKSSDEIGRLGAELLMNGVIAPQGYATDFKPAFR